MVPNTQSNMRIVDNTHKKIKEIFATTWIDELMWVFIIMFVALGAFSLGIIYERKQYLERNPVEIKYSQQALDLWNDYHNTDNQSKNFFASRSGSIVYPAKCQAGKRVNDENKIYFNSLEQAIAEGYKKASNC